MAPAQGAERGRASRRTGSARPAAGGGGTSSPTAGASTTLYTSASPTTLADKRLKSAKELATLPGVVSREACDSSSRAGRCRLKPRQRRRSTRTKRDSSSTRAWRRFICTSRRALLPTVARASTRSGLRRRIARSGRTRARGRRRGPALPAPRRTSWRRPRRRPKICSWPGRGYVVRARTRPVVGSIVVSAVGPTTGSSRRRLRARRRAPSAGPSPTRSSRGDNASVASSTCPWATAP